jgi:GNAT superfamily N-acetyltransferase
MPDHGAQYQLRSPTNEAEWQSYHEIRRIVLWEARGQGSAYDPNRPDEQLPNRFAQILFFEGVPVGVLRIDIEPPKAIFRRVAVRIEHQRKGHGRMMLMLAEEFVRKHGCVCVRSGVAADAVRFYESCGFRRSSPTSGVASVPMEKVL